MGRIWECLIWQDAVDHERDGAVISDTLRRSYKSHKKKERKGDKGAEEKGE